MIRAIHAAAPPGVDVGIGDDAAVLRPAEVTPSQPRLVWTIDEQVEGTHFGRGLVSWADIGWRSFMAAASDIAAMGAQPWCALCALVLPTEVDDASFEEIVRGQRDAASVVGAPIVGGNLARGPVLSLATTLLGSCTKAVERRGALAGDALWMAGRVGLAAAGLRALERGKSEDPRLAEALAAWRRPRALVQEGKAMAGIAHAAVDVSDGLACDAGHLGDASSVQIVLDARALVEDEGLARAAEAVGEEALHLALNGGEDYALVAASERPLSGFRPIGEVRKGEGVILRTTAGERRIEAVGFDHFRAR